VHVEVDGAEDEIALESAAGSQIFWHHRRPGRGASAELEDAARTSEITTDTRVRVACETIAVRRIRQHFLEDRGLPLELTVTRGYWRLGLADYHDENRPLRPPLLLNRAPARRKRMDATKREFSLRAANSLGMAAEFATAASAAL
jgi:hypothetical protein